MFVIIYPLITKVTGKEIDINSVIDKETKMTYSEIGNELTLNTDRQVEETYILKIKENVKQGIEEKGYSLSKIDIEIETEDENKYGEIKKVYLTVKEDVEDNKNKEENSNAEKNKADAIKKVEKVNVNSINVNKTSNVNNNAVEESKDSKNNLSKKQINEIKKYLQDTYGIKKENIYINN